MVQLVRCSQLVKKPNIAIVLFVVVNVFKMTGPLANLYVSYAFYRLWHLCFEWCSGHASNFRPSSMTLPWGVEIAMPHGLCACMLVRACTPANVCAHFLTTAGFEIFQVRENITRDSSGGVEGHAGPHHVLIQTGHCQVWGVGSADTCGAVCT